MGLYEELAQTFPLENVHPYGVVLIIPCSSFKPEWESILKSEGVQVYTNSYDGKMCFFLRKKDSQTVKAEAKPTPTPTPSEQLKPLEWSEETFKLIESWRTQGLGYRRIVEKFREMGFKTNTTTLLRKLKQREGLKENLNCTSENESLFHEYLEASRLLYPKFKRACALLLREASSLL